jgi:hypothetical protein
VPSRCCGPCQRHHRRNSRRTSSSTPAAGASKSGEEPPGWSRPPEGTGVTGVEPAVLEPSACDDEQPRSAPKKVHAGTDEQVKSPPITAIRVTIFDEAGQHPFGWPLTPVQVKAGRAVDPKGFRDPAAYLRALADALQPLSPANNRKRVVQKLTE